MSDTPDTNIFVTSGLARLVFITGEGMSDPSDNTFATKGKARLVYIVNDLSSLPTDNALLNSGIAELVYVVNPEALTGGGGTPPADTWTGYATGFDWPPTYSTDF